MPIVGPLDWARLRPNENRAAVFGPRAQVVASPRRIAPAERPVVLVNDGKCAEASEVALNEGDRRLARRIETVCRQNN